MIQLQLNEEQARLVSQAQGCPVDVRGPDGTHLGRLQPELSAEFVAELKRRAKSAGPWYTSEQVSRRLQSLEEEWNRLGGFDQRYMLDFLARLNEADPGFMRPQESP